MSALKESKSHQRNSSGSIRIKDVKDSTGTAQEQMKSPMTILNSTEALESNRPITPVSSRADLYLGSGKDEGDFMSSVGTTSDRDSHNKQLNTSECRKTAISNDEVDVGLNSGSYDSTLKAQLDVLDDADAVLLAVSVVRASVALRASEIEQLENSDGSSVRSSLTSVSGQSHCDHDMSTELDEQLRTAVRYLSKLPSTSAQNQQDPNALNGVGPKGDERMRVFVSMNGLSALVDLTRHYAEHTPLHALKALYRLSSADEHLRDAVAAQVPQVVVELLMRHQQALQNASRRGSIQDTLERQLPPKKQSQEKVKTPTQTPTAGGKKSNRVLGELPRQLLSDGLLLLGNMAFDSEARAEIGKSGGVMVVTQLMHDNILIPELVDQCCYALANLAVESPDNMRQMLNADIVRLALAAMIEHPTHTALLESATFVLTNLCAYGPEARLLIVQSGVGKVLRDVLMYEPSPFALTSAVLRTLGNLACSSTAVHLLIHDDILKAFVKLLHSSNTDPTHVELTALVLANMAAEASLKEMRVVAHVVDDDDDDDDDVDDSNTGVSGTTDTNSFDRVEVLPALVSVCEHSSDSDRVLPMMIGFVDTLCIRVPELCRKRFILDKLLPLLVRLAPPLLSRTEASSTAHHTLHILGVLAGHPPNAELMWRDEALLETLVAVVSAQAVDSLISTSPSSTNSNPNADAGTSSSSTSSAGELNRVALSAPQRRGSIVLENAASTDVGSALQAIWCLGRLSVHASFEQVNQLEVAELAKRMLECLMQHPTMVFPSKSLASSSSSGGGGSSKSSKSSKSNRNRVSVSISKVDGGGSGGSSKPQPNWSAVAVCVRVLAVLCQKFHEHCTIVGRYAMSLISRSLATLAESERPDADASASFSLLLVTLSQSATARLHLNVTVATSICRLLQTATRADGTMTVAAADAFIRVLCCVAATDRRGQVRRVLVENRVLSVADALIRGAYSQFGHEKNSPSKSRAVDSLSVDSGRRAAAEESQRASSLSYSEYDKVESMDAKVDDSAVQKKSKNDGDEHAAYELAQAVQGLHDILDTTAARTSSRNLRKTGIGGSSSASSTPSPALVGSTRFDSGSNKESGSGKVSGGDGGASSNFRFPNASDASPKSSGVPHNASRDYEASNDQRMGSSSPTKVALRALEVVRRASIAPNALVSSPSGHWIQAGTRNRSSSNCSISTIASNDAVTVATTPANVSSQALIVIEDTSLRSSKKSPTSHDEPTSTMPTEVSSGARDDAHISVEVGRTEGSRCTTGSISTISTCESANDLARSSITSQSTSTSIPEHPLAADDDHNDEDDNDKDGVDNPLRKWHEEMLRGASLPILYTSDWEYKQTLAEDKLVKRGSHRRTPSEKQSRAAAMAAANRGARAQGIADTVTAVKARPSRQRIRSTDGLCSPAQLLHLSVEAQADARMARAIDDGSAELHGTPMLSPWTTQKRSCLAAVSLSRIERATILAALPAIEHGADRDAAWTALLSECGGSVERLRQHRDVHALVRTGVPQRHREAVWMLLSGAELLRLRYNDGYYDKLVRIASEVGTPNGDEILKDVPRTLPHLALFQSEAGRASLSRVLCAYCLRNSESVGYCQSMNNICGALLTQVEGESAAFWLLSSLIESRMGYYCKSMCALLVDQRVLRDLVSFDEPELYDHLATAGVEIESFTTSWFLCLFLEAPLRMDDAFVVWDHLLLYGDEVLFQVALAIFRHAKQRILRLANDSELLLYVLHGIALDIPPIATLLDSIRIGDMAERVALLRSLHRHAVVAENSELRPGTLLALERQSIFNEDEIAELWRQFLSPAPWHVLLHASLPTVAALQRALSTTVFAEARSTWRDAGLMSGLIKRLFEVFDSNGTRQIDFNEFVALAQVYSKGVEDEKLAFCFRFADQNDDRLVSRSELHRLISMLEHSYNGRRHADNAATQFCDAVFDGFGSTTDYNTQRHHAPQSTDGIPSTTETTTTGLQQQMSRVEEPTLDYEEFCHFALLHPLICSFFQLEPANILNNSL